MLYALRGPLAASVGRFAVREYRDSHKGIKRRDGPENGLYGGFVFWPIPCPDGQGRKNAACKPLEGHTSGGKLAGSIRDIAAHAGRPGGHKKARPGVGRVVVVTL